SRDLAHHEPGDLHPSGLGVLGVRAVVPLLGRRHRDDLAGVRGVGEHLLVAGHPGVEHGLAEGLPRRAERRPAERRAVLENEQRLASAHRWALPSATTSSPRWIVWTTGPVSVRPRNALFRLREANGGSTVHVAAGSNTTRLAG